MTDETAEIDPRNNPESQMNDEGVNQTGSAPAGDTGVVMSDAPSVEEGRHGVIGGHITGADDGNVLGGLTGGDTDTSA